MRSSVDRRSLTFALGLLPYALVFGLASVAFAQTDEAITDDTAAEEAVVEEAATGEVVAETVAVVLPIPQDSFVLALTGTPQSFDPRNTVRNIEARVVNNLYEGLYMPPVGEGPAVPGVAASYDISDDGLVYTFHLRPEARWSNGDPVTASDFVYAWQRVLEPGGTYPYAHLVVALKNGRAYIAGEASTEELGVQAVDDQTLRVELEEPVSFFVELTAFAPFFPVHRATVQELGADAFLSVNLVTNGPFQIESFEPRSSLILTKNPHFWDADSVQLSRVSMRTFTDEEASLNAYLSGEVEWLDELPWDRLSSLRFREDFQDHPMFGTYYFRVNVTHAVFSDPRVRQALSLAIDRDAICRHVIDELCTAATSFVPPMQGYEPVGVLAYDPVSAQELMLEAGFENGEGFPTLRLLFNSLELHQRIAEAVTEMWRTNIGIEVELVEHPWDGYLEALDNMDYHVARFGWIGDYLDPDSFLYLMVSQNVAMNGGWANTAYDELVRQAAPEQDREHRFELLRAAEAILLTELPVIPLFYYTQYQLLQPTINGFVMNARDVHLFRYIYKTPVEQEESAPATEP